MTDLDETEVIRIENKLAGILALIYVRIPWSKIKVQNAHKFFIDRIRASSNTRTFKEYLDVLCMKTQVEMVQIDTEDIEYLNGYNNVTMQLLRKESLYICNLALETADNIKKGKTGEE
jgi:hypothetical protein